MKKRSTNIIKAFELTLGIAFMLILFVVVVAALNKGGFDLRSKAALLSSNKCVASINACLQLNGQPVSRLYCGATCKNVCCKLSTIRIVPTRFEPPTKFTPTPTRFMTPTMTPKYITPTPKIFTPTPTRIMITPTPTVRLYTPTPTPTYVPTPQMYTPTPTYQMYTPTPTPYR